MDKKPLLLNDVPTKAVCLPMLFQEFTETTNAVHLVLGHCDFAAIVMYDCVTQTST